MSALLHKALADVERGALKSAIVHLVQHLKEQEEKRGKLIAQVQRALKFWQTNQNDPHGIGNAMIAALSEINEALKELER